MTGLEALKKIDNTICLNNIKWSLDKYDHCDCKDMYEYVNCFTVIRKELKEHEKMLKDIFPHPKEHGEEYRRFAVKRLLALDIIKDICNLKVCKNKLGQCFLKGTHIVYAIDNETYDLLKGVLL